MSFIEVDVNFAQNKLLVHNEFCFYLNLINIEDIVEMPLQVVNLFTRSSY